MEKKHINDVQPSTTDEHLRLLLEDKNIIDPKFTSATPNDLPDWYDQELFKKAQNYYKRNLLSMLLSNFVGLLAIIVVPETLRVLIYTKKSSMPCITFSRYVQTLLHMYKLHTCDPNDPNSDWYKTINVIRQKHKISSKNAMNARVGGIYQRDVAITQFAFIGYVLIAPTSIGLRNEPEEEEALNHLWRVIGHMIEIPNRLNLCRKTAAETRELCQKLANVLAKYLSEAPYEFYHIVSAILDGLWYFDLTLDKDALLAFTYRLHGIKYKKSLDWYSQINIKYRDLIFYLCLIPYIGTIVKMFFNYQILLALWLVKKWSLLAWYSLGKENCRIILYSKYYCK